MAKFKRVKADSLTFKTGRGPGGSKYDDVFAAVRNAEPGEAVVVSPSDYGVDLDILRGRLNNALRYQFKLPDDCSLRSTVNGELAIIKK